MIKKQHLKKEPICKVTFILEKKRASHAKKVNLVGDFNEWNKTNIEMTPLKSGDFKVILPLEKDKQYQFRYLVDGTRWENDSHADGYIANGIGNEENCVVSV